MNADERKVRFHIEKLEERIAPARSSVGGILAVTPPGAADGHSMEHQHPLTGEAGLATAETRSGVVSWTPT